MKSSIPLFHPNTLPWIHLIPLLSPLYLYHPIPSLLHPHRLHTNAPLSQCGIRPSNPPRSRRFQSPPYNTRHIHPPRHNSSPKCLLRRADPTHPDCAFVLCESRFGGKSSFSFSYPVSLFPLPHLTESIRDSLSLMINVMELLTLHHSTKEPE
jgi:hypothetical protein